MPDRTIFWFRIDLPVEKCPTRDLDFCFVDAQTGEGLKLFAQTHVRAYGEAFQESDIDLYELDLRDGIIERDKTLTMLLDGKPVGCIAYAVHKKPNGEEFILIANAGVPQQLQGTGLGRELYARLMNLLVDSYPAGMTVLADLHNGNEASKKIIRNLGFHEVEVESWFPVAL